MSAKVSWKLYKSVYTCVYVSTHVKVCRFVYERFICLVLDAYSWDWLASEKSAQMSNVSLRHILERGYITCVSKYVVSFLLECHTASPTQALSFHLISHSYLFLLQHTWFCLHPWFLSSLCINNLRFCLCLIPCNYLGMWVLMHT